MFRSLISSDRNASTYLEFGTGIGPTTTSVAAHSSDADHRIGELILVEVCND